MRYHTISFSLYPTLLPMCVRERERVRERGREREREREGGREGERERGRERLTRLAHRLVVHVPVLVRGGVRNGRGKRVPVCARLSDAWYNERKARRVAGARAGRLFDARSIAAGAALAGRCTAGLERPAQIPAAPVLQLLPARVAAFLAVAKSVAADDLEPRWGIPPRWAAAQQHRHGAGQPATAAASAHAASERHQRASSSARPPGLLLQPLHHAPPTGEQSGCGGSAVDLRGRARPVRSPSGWCTACVCCTGRWQAALQCRADCTRASPLVRVSGSPAHPGRPATRRGGGAAAHPGGKCLGGCISDFLLILTGVTTCPIPRSRLVPALTRRREAGLQTPSISPSQPVQNETGSHPLCSTTVEMTRRERR